MGSSPIPDMSLVRLDRTSLWMEDDSLRALATRLRPAPSVHASARQIGLKREEKARINFAL